MAIPRAGASGQLEAQLRTQARETSFIEANARLGQAWGERMLSRTTLRTHFAQLRALDVPAVLEMFHPSRTDTSFVTLLGLDAANALVAAGDDPPVLVPVTQVETFWTREAVVAWPEDEVLRADPAQRMAWARGILSGLGYSEPDPESAVRRFQRDAQLVSDGLLGPRTRLALFARTADRHPRLSAGMGTRP